MPTAGVIWALVLGLLASSAAQQTPSNAQVSVSTPQQLLQALNKQVPHIVITKHMDVSTAFTTTTAMEDGETGFTSASGKLLKSGTKTIKVCSCAACSSQV